MTHGVGGHGWGWGSSLATAGIGYLIQDTYNDTNGTALANHVPNVDVEGGGYSNLVGGTNFTIQSNSLDCSGGNDQIVGIDSGQSNVSVNIANVTAGENFGAFARGTGSGLNLILGRLWSGGDTADMFACQGSYTSIGSTAHTVNSGDSISDLEVRVNGTSVKFIIDGVTKLNLTSSVHQSETVCGPFGYGEDGTLDYDNFTVVAI